MAAAFAASLATLAGSLAAQSQPNRVYRRHEPPMQSRVEDFVACAEALPRLYDEKAFDSIGLFLHQRVQTSISFESDLYSLTILLAIQQHRFVTNYLGNAALYYGLDRYVQDATASHTEFGFSGPYDSWDLDLRPYYDKEYSVIAEWAESLLKTRNLTTTEAFLCRSFAGDFNRPRKVIRSNRQSLKELNRQMDASFGALREQKSYSIYFGAGAWIPTGRLALFGSHPTITAVGIGKKSRLYEWDFTIAFRFAATAHPYTVWRQDSLYTTSNFFGGCIGLDLTRYIIHTRLFEAGPLAGIGFDGFDVNDNYYESSPSGPPPPTSINSLNLHPGWRMNYYLDPRHYIGIISKYNFVWYSNPGGTPLNGNAATIDLIFGFN